MDLLKIKVKKENESKTNFLMFLLWHFTDSLII